VDLKLARNIARMARSIDSVNRDVPANAALVLLDDEITRLTQIIDANDSKLEQGCALYCSWYETGKPSMNGSGMAYELVSCMRTALSQQPQDSP
jgi:hypothetical protein